MTVNELCKECGFTPLCLPDGERSVSGAYIGDLLSWVMGRATENCVWATIMTNLNVVAVASLVGVACVVICEGSEIGDDIIATAKEKDVNVLRSPLPIYEVCVELSKSL